MEYFCIEDMNKLSFDSSTSFSRRLIGAIRYYAVTKSHAETCVVVHVRNIKRSSR